MAERRVVADLVGYLPMVLQVAARAQVRTAGEYEEDPATVMWQSTGWYPAGGNRVVAAEASPVSMSLTVSAGMATTETVDGSDTGFAALGRWLAEDATPLRWEHRSTPGAPALMSFPGREPEKVPANRYSYFRAASLSWTNVHAMRFSAGSSMSTQGGGFAELSRAGLIATMVLGDAADQWPIPLIGFNSPDYRGAMISMVSSNALALTADDGEVLALVGYAPMDPDTAVTVGMWWADHDTAPSLLFNVKHSTQPWQNRAAAWRFPHNMAASIQICPSDYEASVEFLDIALVNDGVHYLQALNIHREIYGT